MRAALPLAVLLVLGGCAGPAADGPAADGSTPTAEPTASPVPTLPVKPLPPPLPDGTYVAGPMAPSCPDPDAAGWRYPPTNRWTVTVEEPWSDEAEAIRLAERAINRSDQVGSLDLRPVEGNYSHVGFRGDVVDVSAEFGTDRYVLAAGEHVVTSFTALVLAYDDRTEVVVYRSVNYC